MKLLYLFLLFPLFSFAQKGNNPLKVKLIDSIAKTNGPETESSGLIQKKKLLFWKKTIGGFSEDIYMDSIMNPDNTKKKHLIKASYQRSISVTKKNIKYLYSDFYYDKTLFFVRIKKIKEDKETGIFTRTYEIDLSEDINPEIDNELGFDVKKWINLQDSRFKETVNWLYNYHLSISTY